MFRLGELLKPKIVVVEFHDPVSKQIVRFKGTPEEADEFSRRMQEAADKWLLEKMMEEEQKL